MQAREPSIVSAPTFERPNRGIVRLLWIITLFLVLIGVAIVIRRALNHIAPSSAPKNFPEGAAMDTGFATRPLLTMVHIFPGLLFMVLGPLQFVGRLRSRKPALHRWMGRVALASGLIIGTTALVMSPQMAIGGANETVATMFFATFFLVALIKAFLAIRRGNVTLHREWMIRAFAIGLAVATIRPIVGVFFATRNLGFTMHLIAAEIWINYTRRPTLRSPYR